MRLNVLPEMARLPQGTDPSRLEHLAAKRGDPEAERQRLHDAADEFETLLVESMLREMRKNVPQSELFGKSSGRDLFQEMLDGEYARLMVRRGGLGLADMLVRQLDTSTDRS